MIPANRKKENEFIFLPISSMFQQTEGIIMFTQHEHAGFPEWFLRKR
jgi:hypothetical protein